MNDKSHAATPIAAQISNSHPSLDAGQSRPVTKAICHPATHPVAGCETIEQHLKRLYPTEYTKIITNATKDAGPEHTASLLGYYARGQYSHPLEVMFLWANTPEGYAFWQALNEWE